MLKAIQSALFLRALAQKLPMLLLSMVLSSIAWAGEPIISIDFRDATTTAMGSGESAGVVPAINWNDAAAQSGTNVAITKGDQSGVGVTIAGVTMTWASTFAPATAPITEAPGNARMMRGYLDTNNGTTSTVTVSGLTTALYANGYVVYVYTDGSNNETRAGLYSISTNSQICTDNANVHFSGAFVRAANSPGNYLVFSGLTAASFTLSATPRPVRGAPRAAINAIQIVPIGAAPEFVWTGQGADSNWSTAANWLGGVAPTPAANSSLVFPVSAAKFTSVNNLAAASNFGSLVVLGDGYSISGNSIRINDELLMAPTIPNTSNAATLALDLVLPANRTLQIETGSTLTHTGAISGGFGITKAGGGTYVASGQSTFTGDFNHNAGTLGISANSTPVTRPLTSGPVGIGLLNINNASPIRAVNALRELGNAVVLANNNMVIDGTESIRFNGPVRMNNAARTITVNLPGNREALFNGRGATGPGTAPNDNEGSIVRGGAANQTLTKAGTGTMVLTGPGNWLGQILITSGVVRCEGADGKLSDGNVGPDVRVDAGATLILDNTVAPAAFGVAGRIADGDTVQLKGNNANFVLNGNLAGTTEVVNNLQTINGNPNISITAADAGHAALSISSVFSEPLGKVRFIRGNTLSTGTGEARIFANNFVASQYIPFITISGPTSAIVDRPAEYSVTQGVIPVGGMTYTSVSSGNWDTATTWTPNGIPGTGDTAIIDLAHSISLNNATRTAAIVTFRGSGSIVPGGVAGVLAIERVLNTESGSASITAPITLINSININTLGAELQVGLMQGGAGIGYTKQGSGKLAITETSTLSGAINFSTGTLGIGANNALGTGALNINNNVAANASGYLECNGTFSLANPVTLNGDLRTMGSGDLTLNGTVTLAAADRGINVLGKKLILNNANSLTGAGRLMAKQGGGELVINGSSTGLTGSGTPAVSTRLDNGILTLNNAGGLGANTAALLFNNVLANGEQAPTLNVPTSLTIANPLRLTVGGAQSTVRFTGAGNITFSGTTTLLSTLSIKVDSPLLALNGAVSGAFSITKLGSGTMQFNSASTYTGNTQINEGTLRLMNAATLGTGTPVQLNIGGTLEVDSAGASNPNRIPDTATLNFRGGTFRMAANATTVRTEVVGAITFELGASVIDLAANGANESRLESAAAIPVPAAGTALTFIRQNATANATLRSTNAGQTTGAQTWANVNGLAATYQDNTVGLVAVTSAVFTTAQDGDWDTTTTWVGGTVPPTDGTANVVVGHNVTINTVATHSVNSLTLNGGGLTGTQALTVLAGGIHTSTTAPAITVACPIVMPTNLNIVTNNISSNPLTISGVISSTGTPAVLTKGGLGTLVLSGTNTFAVTGSVTVAGGVLSVSANANLGAAANRIRLAGGGTLANTADINFGARVLEVTNGAGKISVPAGLTMTFGGALDGANTLFKDGLGRAIFNVAAAGTRTGNITVNQGFLRGGANQCFAPNSGTPVVNMLSGTVLEFTANQNDDLPTVNMFDGSRVVAIGNITEIGNKFTILPGATVTVEHNTANPSDQFVFGDGAQDMRFGDGRSLVVFEAGVGRIVVNQDNGGYEGTVRVASGRLQLGNNNALGDNNPVPNITRIANSATVIFNSDSRTPFIVENGGNIRVTGANRTLNVTNLQNQFNNTGSYPSLRFEGTAVLNLDDPLSTPVVGRSLILQSPIASAQPLQITASSSSAAVSLFSFSNAIPAVSVTNAGLTLNNPESLSVPASITLNSAVLNLLSNTSATFAHSIQAFGDSTLSVNNVTSGTAQTILTSNFTVASAGSLTVVGGNNYVLRIPTLSLPFASYTLINDVEISTDSITGVSTLLNKSGGGRLSLNGASTAAGALSATGGEVRLNGSTGSLQFSSISIANSVFTISDDGLAADYNRVPDSTSLSLTNGTLNLLAPNNVVRSEVVGALSFSGSNNIINITPFSTGTGDAVLTASFTPTPINGTVTFNRNFTGTAAARLIPLPDPGNGTTFNAFTVIESTVSGSGVNLTGQGIVAFGATPFFVYTSVQSGPWNSAATWTSTPAGGTFPGAADTAIVSPGHVIDVQGTQSVNRLTFRPNGVAQTSGVTGSGVLNVTSGRIKVDRVAFTGGLRALYYDKEDFTTPFATILDPQVNVLGNSTNLPIGFANTTHSVVWTGYVIPPVTGVYTFRTRSDDGSRVWINGLLVADGFGDQGATNYDGTITLEGGVPVMVREEYYQGGGGFECNLSWSTPQSSAFTVIPAANLIPASGSISLGNINTGTNAVNLDNQGGGDITISSLTGVGLSVSGGNLILPNGSALSGNSALNNGRITAGAPSAIPGTLTVNGGTLATATNMVLANPIVLDGGLTVAALGFNSPFTLSGNILLTGNRTIYGAGVGPATNAATMPTTVVHSLTGVISDGGNGYSLTKGGIGTVRFGATNTYSGGTTIVGGRVFMDAPGAIPQGALALGGFNGITAVTLDVLGQNLTVSQISLLPGALAANNSVVNTSATLSVLTLNGSGDSSLAPVLTGPIQLVKQSTSVLTLLNAGNSYLGGTLVQGGTLRNGAANVIPNNGVTLEAGTTYDANNFAETIDNLVMNGGTVTTGTGLLTLTNGSSITATGASAINGLLSLNTTAAVAVNTPTLADTLTINALISSGAGGGLAKGGSGTLVLGGANTYVGPTAVNGGTLRLNGNTGAINTSSVLNINTGTRFEIDNALGAGPISRIGDTVPVNINGGTFAMTAPSNASRSETVGTITYNGFASIELTATGANNCQLTMNNAVNPLPVRGSGLLNFVRTNGTPGTANLFTSTGTDGLNSPFITVNDQVSVYNGNASAGQGLIANNAVVFVTQRDGDWDIAGNNSTAFGPTVAGIPIPNGADITIRHNVRIIGNVQPLLLTFDQNLGGAPYGLRADTAATLGVNRINVSGTAAPILGANVNIAAGATVLFVNHTGTGVAVINGVISGTAGVIKEGTGTLALGNAANTFSPSLSIPNGRLEFSGNLGANANTVSLSGGVLACTATNTIAQTLNVTSGEISIGTGLTLTVSNAMGAGNGNLLKTGAGTLELSANNTTRSGVTTINDGVLRVLNNQVFGGAGASVVVNNATLSIGTPVAGNPAPLAVNPVQLNDNARVLVDVVVNGTSTSQIGSTLNVAADANVTVETLAGDGIRLGNITGGSPNSTFTLLAAARISLNQATTYRGTWICNASTGNVDLKNNASLGNALNLVRVVAGTFNTNNIGLIIPNPFRLENGIFGHSEGNAGTTGTYTGAIEVVGNIDLLVDQGGAADAFLNLTGPLSGTGSLSLNSAKNRVTIANLTSTFSGSITVQATKLLRLAPNGGVSPTMDLPCTINMNGGTLELFNNENTAFTTSVNVNNPSIILADRQGGTNTNRTLSLTQVTLNGATLTLNSNNGFAMSTPTLAVTAGTTVTSTANFTVSQTLSGAGILSKNGVGTLTLLGDGTAYTATALNVQAGVLVVNNTVGSATGNATVNLNGNTLRGAGTVAGITATTGATVDPGNGAGSPGTLTAIGNVTFASGVNLSLQINGATAGTYDSLSVTGASPTANLAGATLTLSAPGGMTTTNDILTILPVSGSNAVVGTFANLPQGTLIVLGGRLLQISYTGGDGNDVTLTDIGAQQVGVRVVPTALTIPEAGPAQTFSVVLTQAPLGNVVIDVANTLPAEGTLGSSQLTFTTTNWNQLQTVSVSPINDLVDDGDTVLTAQLTVNAAGSSNEYDPVDPADVAVTIVDDDTAGITVTAPSVVTTESGGLGTFTVRLNSQPTSPVTINLTSSDLTEGTVTASLTFAADATAVNPQTVTVTGVDDLVVDGTITYTIVTAPATSADGLYNGLDPADASATNTDNDAIGVVNSQTTITTTEGGTAATFTVRLASQPFDVVTVTLTSNDLTEGQINGVNPLVLTFQPDATALAPQTVSITPQDDLLDDGNVSYTITYAVASTGDAAYNGLAAGPVNVTNNDNDVSSVAFSRTTVTTAEGGAVETFTVNLTAQPTDVVTVTLTSNDLTEGQINGVNPLVLTFQPDATALTPQTVTITPQEDSLDDGDITYTITGAVASASDANYNGQTTTVVNVTNTDNDTVGFTFSRVAVDTIEGGVVEQFTVRLNSQPLSQVTLTLTSGDLTEGQVNGVNPLVLTFNADATALNNQTVSITPQNDALIDGLISYSITTAVASSDTQYSVLTVPTIAVRNFDDDEGTFISTTTLSTSEAAAPGGAQSFTLALSTVPSAPVTITVTGLNSEGLLSTNTLVFAANETALTAQTLSVSPVDDLIDDGDVNYNITFAVVAGSAAEYIGLGIPSISVTNADNDTANISVTPTTLATVEGGPAASFGITLGTQPTADVVIALTNGDTTEGTLSVPALTFTPVNWNVAQTVTVAPVADSVTDGNVTYTIVTTATSSDLVYNGFTVADVSVTNTDEPAPVISSALTVAPSPATVGVPVTLTFAASDPQGQPVTVTFDYGDGTNGTATTHTYTVPQIVTLTATVTDGVNVLTSSFTLIVLSAASPDADVDRDGLPNSQDLDDDNDGFSDVIEIAAGTDPFNAGSSPGANNGPAGTPGPLPVIKMAIKLNFGKANLDGIQMSGTLNIPAGFVVANQKVVVDIGGVARSFILNAKGQSPKALDSFKLSVKSSGGAVPIQVGKWSLKFNKGSYSASLADEGLTNATVTKQNRTVKVQMVFNQKLLERNVIQSYSSKAGKSGKTSSPK